MNNLLSSLLPGLGLLILLFAACFIAVVGVKTVFFSVKDIVARYKSAEKPAEKSAEPIKPTPKQTQTAKRRVYKRRIPRPERSIEINPNEIDRIYVRRSS